MTEPVGTSEFYKETKIRQTCSFILSVHEIFKILWNQQKEMHHYRWKENVAQEAVRLLQRQSEYTKQDLQLLCTKATFRANEQL